MVDLNPEAAVAPILIFIGLEITAQAFHAAPQKHTKAVALAFLPSIADLVLIQWSSLLGHLGKRPADLQGQAASTFQMIVLFANGFVITSLLWGAGLALIIDRRLRAAAAFFGAGAVLAFFGMIHSPFDDGRIFFPWQIATTLPYSLSAAYGLMAAFLLAMAWRERKKERV
jgi:AGZA family xanthine/uracil permease-like MFS transporter